MKKLFIVLVLVAAACGNAEPVVQSSPELGETPVTAPAPALESVPTPPPTLASEFEESFSDLLAQTVEGVTPEEAEAMAACSAAHKRADSQAGIVLNLIQLVVADIRAAGLEPSGPGWDQYTESFLEAVELAEAEERAWNEDPEHLLIGLLHRQNQALARSMAGMAIWSAGAADAIEDTEQSMSGNRLALLAEQSAILAQQLSPCLS